MKIISIAAVAALVATSLFTACNKAPVSDAPTDKPSGNAALVRAEADPGIPEKKVEISANDQMKFDVVAIEAKPRQKITVTLKNIGTIPKMSMGHNLVLLEKDVDPPKFVETSQTSMATEYIAPELKNKVIAHTKLLGPGESDTVSFAAPKEPGAYTYICSFPGHFAIGMKGVLTVQ